MSFLPGLDGTHPTGHAILVLSLIAMVGLALGHLKIRGIGLGIAGVLFAGIGFGHFGFEIDHTILDFTRDFGLVLFVYTIGMQVGPGFFSSLRKQGLSFNLMAIVIVAMGGVLALLMGRLMNFPIGAVVGLFSGATTNTPSLGAAQEALKGMPGVTPAATALPALAYAAAYPFGIMGIIFTMLFLRWIFRIDPKKEAVAFKSESGMAREEIRRLNIEVENESCDGIDLADLALPKESKVVISRVYNHGTQTVCAAAPTTRLHLGDVILAVGAGKDVDAACRRIGKPARIDLMKEQGPVIYRDVIVTRKDVIGRSLAQLGLENIFGVAISRVTRAAVEMTAVPNFRLQFGDRVRIVGDSERIKQVTSVLGNALGALNHTHFIPVFIGITLGVLVGSIPFQIAGMPAPVTLGLAGGPLIVAIILSRLGRVGPLVWYMPLGANLALRELGIILFLACVGLKAGSRFVEILLHGDGLIWMASAALITVVPLLSVGLVARLFLRQNFMNICGVLAGTMTDPPALAFANNISDSDAPSVAYATVYPLTMLLRILAAQAIVLFFR
jgi:putative transport protein